MFKYNLLEMQKKILNGSNKIVRIYKTNELKVIEIGRSIFILILISLLFSFFQPKINVFLVEYIIPAPGWSNKFVDSLFFLAFILVYLYGLRLLFKLYIFSRFQKFILISAILLLLIFHTSEKAWVFSPFFINDWGLTYFHLLFGLLVHFLGIILYNSLVPRRKNENIMSFFEDNSIRGSLSEPDLLNYTALANDLKEKISNQTFMNSFTVGIIGPWGNGKSSFINLLEKELENSDCVAFHFKPYLNHSEEEISMEFFYAFQEALRPYSGKISDLILEYSDKLLNLYHSKNIKNFFRKENANIETSANSTFSKINSSLHEINKKIIVFVDDLDRLNEKEILQVLKLIRNTANFVNTTFILGLDKSYVLKQINANNNVLNNNFLDKFFQLELYLPEIETSILRKEFKRILQETNAFGSEIAFAEFESALDLEKILFEDHIKNLRDVKRVSNQILFEYKFASGEINLTDFVNFVLLKLEFPNFITSLRKDPEKYFENTDQFLVLRKKRKDESEEFEINRFSKYENFQLYEDLIEKNQDELQRELGISNDESILLIKTLVILFGTDNPSSAPNSIRFASNFRRFIQLDYKESDFLPSEFIRIINIEDVSNLVEVLEELEQKNHQMELVDSLKYFKPQSLFALKNGIYIYAFAINKSYGVDDYSFLRNLAAFLFLNIEYQPDPSHNLQDLREWFITNILSNSSFKSSTQLLIISYLWETKRGNDILGIETGKIKTLSLEKFDNLLSHFKNSEWDYGDSTIIRIYIGLKSIEGLKEDLNKKLIEFLNSVNIDVFCAQCTEFVNLHPHMFGVSDLVNDIFGSKRKFVLFVKEHNYAKNKNVKEYLHFLNLCEITNFSLDISFRFKLFDYIKNKVNKTSPTENSKIRFQVFFKFHSKEDFEFLKEKLNANPLTSDENTIKSMRFFTHKENYFIVATSLYEEDKVILNSLLAIFGVLQGKYSKNEIAAHYKTKFKKEELFIKNNNSKVLLSVYEIQPL